MSSNTISGITSLASLPVYLTSQAVFLNALQRLSPQLLPISPAPTKVYNIDYITPEFLESFNFSIEDIRRIFNEADTYGKLQSAGNKLLTQNELDTYLLRTQTLLPQRPDLKTDFRILQVFSHYFELIADVQIKTGFSSQRVLSAKQVESIASLNNNPNDFSAQDIQQLLQNRRLPPGAVETGEMLARSEAVRRTLPPIVVPDHPLTPPVSMYHSDAPIQAIERSHSARDTQTPIPKDILEIEDLAENFTYATQELTAMMNRKTGTMSVESLQILLHVCQNSQRHMAALLTQPQQTQNSTRLKIELTGTRRVQNLARILKNNFARIAQLDGDGTTISLEDIRVMVALDGDNQNFTLHDLQVAIKQNSHA